MDKNLTPHKNLEAWKTAMILVEDIYNLTKKFPEEEKFGLISQMRRASISVPSNIAEGAADRSAATFCHFLSVAIGSLAELDTQVELSYRLSFINLDDQNRISKTIDKAKALIFGLRRSIKNDK